MRNDFTTVLKTLTLIDKIADPNAKVDRMWERLLEIVLFLRTKAHRQPVEILKSFICSGDKSAEIALSAPELTKLKGIFKFLVEAYNVSNLKTMRLVTDQTHFYTVITSLIASDLMAMFSSQELASKMSAFARIIEKTDPMPKQATLASAIKKYSELSAKQTTHVSRRTERQAKFIEIIKAL